MGQGGDREEGEHGKNEEGREVFGVKRHLSLDRRKEKMPSKQKSFLNC